MRNSFILFSLTFLVFSSCKKESTDPPGVPRTIQFSLYSDKDLSADNGNIVFTLVIENSNSKVLWDSTLAPMKIKDIPDFAHKIVVEKLAPGGNNSLIKVGFLYAIENVGNSWHWDYSSPGETFKKVEFNFQ
jgi:hypothetical protein